MPRLIWSAQSVADLVAINEWLTLNLSPREAAEAIRAIRHHAERLEQFPAIGSPFPSGLRKLIIRDQPFVLLYELSGSERHVLRVVHNRSDWQTLA